jgi:hypothetical protein
MQRCMALSQCRDTIAQRCIALSQRRDAGLKYFCLTNNNFLYETK